MLFTLGGLTLTLFGGLLAAELENALPKAVTVKSAGTFYPQMDTALPFMIRGLGVSLVFAAASAALYARRQGPFPLASGPSWIVPVALVIGAGLLYTWLAFPHNAFPTNARIHWVDIFFERQHDYFYTLVKLHALSYDYPHIFQGLNGGLNVLLVYLIARRLTSSIVLAGAMAASYLGSGQVLLFANGAEDVSLSVAALLFVFWLYLQRTSPWLGLAMFVATLARPQFVFVLFAFVLAELVAPRWKLNSEEKPPFRFVWQNLLSFSLVFVTWHGWLLVTSNNWLLTEHGVIASPLVNIEPQEIDGFLLHQFSGAYVGHLAWLLPLPLIVGNVIAALLRRELSRQEEGVLWLAWAFGLLNIAFLEYHVMHYYNMRYLAYLVPFLLITAWLPIIARNRKTGSLSAVQIAGIVVLALAPLTQYQQGFVAKENVAEHPVASLFDDRQELRQMAQGRDVCTTIQSHTHRNYIAYVFQRAHESIEVVDQGGPHDGEDCDGVVVTRSLEGYDSGSVVYNNGELKMLELGSGEVNAGAGRG